MPGVPLSCPPMCPPPGPAKLLTTNHTAALPTTDHPSITPKCSFPVCMWAHTNRSVCRCACSATCTQKSLKQHAWFPGMSGHAVLNQQSLPCCARRELCWASSAHQQMHTAQDCSKKERAPQVQVEQHIRAQSVSKHGDGAPQDALQINPQLCGTRKGRP